MPAPRSGNAGPGVRTGVVVSDGSLNGIESATSGTTGRAPARPVLPHPSLAAQYLCAVILSRRQSVALRPRGREEWAALADDDQEHGAGLSLSAPRFHACPALYQPHQQEWLSLIGGSPTPTASYLPCSESLNKWPQSPERSLAADTLVFATCGFDKVWERTREHVLFRRPRSPQLTSSAA
jgi:hypothetical protein